MSAQPHDRIDTLLDEQRSFAPAAAFRDASHVHDDEPYAADHPLLPRSLAEALEALEKDALFRRQFGDVFIDYYLRLKRNELARFQAWKEENGESGDEPTAWEQNEYFDFF